MNLTGGTRATITLSGTALLAGILASAYGIIGSNTPHALGGLGLIVAASTAIALAVLRNWIIDTSDERRNLAAAQRQAENQRSQYYAAQANLENELARAAHDMAAQRARNTASLIKEREALRAALEAERLQLSQKAFRMGAQMERAGMLKPDEPAPTNLIQFPHQQPQPQGHPQPERTRPSEHGVSAP
jgi:hypothetical protein